MRTIREEPRDLPVVDEVDVLVVGGGPAGFAAATAAARAGARTLLVERYGYLGGLATGGLVLYMDAIFDRAGTRWIGGLAWEALERLRPLGGLAADSPTRLHADSELLKVVADRLCLEAGARMRLHSWAVGAVVQEGAVRGVIVESKSGRQALLARVTVDASGDGDIAGYAGAEYELGRMRIGLNVKVGGVDRERFRAFQRDHADEMRALRDGLRAQGGVALGLGSTPQPELGVYWVNVRGLAGRDEGEERTVDGESVTASFAGNLNAIDVEDLTYAEIELRQRIMASLDLYRRQVPGWEHVQLLAIASQLGVRDSRHVKGLHWLTQEEVLSARRYPDAIGHAALGYADVGHYQIPYGCLVPDKVDGLLVAGRCISVDHWIINSIRLIPPAMVTGQAAGAAAALAVQAGVQPRDLDTIALCERLASEGVIL